MTQPTSVLCRGLFPIASMGREHFYPGRRRLFVQRVVVILLVADQPFRELLDEAFEQSFRDKGDFTMEFSVRIGRKTKIQ
jgi:hypothetical protein